VARIAIVGAGPAGSSAGWHLASRGHEVNLVDRAAFPRPKTCGDWIPLAAVAELERMGLGPRELEARAPERAPVNATVIAAPDGRDSRCAAPAGGCCIPRFVFDAMLWRHAVDAGCRPIQRSIRDVAALAADHDFVIDARGAHAGTPNAVALRAYWTVDRRRLEPGEDSAVQIHTDARFHRGYGWMFPVGAEADRVRVNVGVGLWAADSVPGQSIADYYDRFTGRNAVLARWREQATIERPVGCHVGLGLAGNTVGLADVLRIGDAANLADPLTGDGIANALKSGRLVADAVCGAATRADAARAWQASHDDVFLPEFRLARRLQRVLTGTTAKNLTARVLTGAPGLRRRVHAALFGETTYRALARGLARPWR
jgi:flavin-dependent dehydrogenase